MDLQYPGSDKRWTDLESDNRANWNDRVGIHSGAPQLQRLIDDPQALSHEVEFDRALLGDVTGADLVHLQCHVGHDTLSLARLGARVTGLDFSARALEVARDLFTRGAADGRFVEASVYDAVAALGSTYDVVFTGVGAIIWLNDIARWASVVASLLHPGGRLYLREAHPMLFTIDEQRPDGELRVAYPYFNQSAPLTCDDGSTYWGDGSLVEHTITHTWNHSLGEVIQALIDSGLALERLAEHDSCDWPAIPWMAESSPGRWSLPDRRERLPLMYTVIARKPR